MAKAYDLIVIGGGPGGYVAAIRAAQLGMKTAIVEREALGGICLNWGCIPTKALLRTSEIRHLAATAADFGLKLKDEGYDAKKVITRSREIAKIHSDGVAYLMKKNKIDVFEGEAVLKKDPGVTVKLKENKTEDLDSQNVIIATGARAREMGELKADGKQIWTYRHAMVPDSIPKTVLVVGSGAIGMEFASFFNDMGSNVKVIEVLPNVLPQEDEDISKAAERAFKKQGIEIATNATVEALKSEKNGVRVKIKAKKTSEETFEKVILAIGITGNVENIGLEGIGVKVEKGHIVTDEWGRTGVPGLWAIGDVTGPPWLAHKAMHEGVTAVEKIAGKQHLHALDVTSVPACTYCRPQVASIGLTEKKAKETGFEVKVGKYPFTANGKATAIGEREGFVKTVFDAKTGELLGAHMIGPEVTELIHGFAIAKTLETTEAELMATIFPHPTLSEAMHESVLAAYGRPLHI